MNSKKVPVLFFLLAAATVRVAASKGKIREIPPLLPNNTVTGTKTPGIPAGQGIVEEDIVIQGGKTAEDAKGAAQPKAADTPFELIPVKIEIDPADSQNDILKNGGNSAAKPADAGAAPARASETTQAQPIQPVVTEPPAPQTPPVASGPAVRVPDRKVTPPPGNRNLDFSNKDTINDIVYVKGEEEPYTGVFTAYIGNVIEYSETYVKGVLDGEEIWYSNGKPNMVYVYKGGKLNGDSYMYYEDGLVKNVQSYKNGNIVSLVSYDRNGRVLHKSAFPDGTGNWKIFWDNGNVLEEGNYKGWKKDGQWKRYQSDGTVDNIKKYQNGKLTGESWN